MNGSRGGDDPALHLRRGRFERDFVFVAALFAVLMVLTNVIGTKLFLLFPGLLPHGFGWLTDDHFVILTTGLVTYPLTFLFTDVCSEIWGRRRANYMVVLGFLASLLMLAVIHVAQAVPRADRFWADAAGQPVHGTRIVRDAASGGARLRVEDASDLLPRPDGTRKLRAAVVVDGRPRTVEYRRLETEGHREDNRGWLILDEPLDEAVPAGSWLVPSVRVEDLLDPEAATIVVDRPRAVPPTGTLMLADGSTPGYPFCGDDGVLSLAYPPFMERQVDPAAITPGTDLAVFATFRPAQLQKNLVSILSAPGILVFASMLAYLVAQFLDVHLYHLWRRLTRGRHLWLRNNGSTMISQLVDTIIVNGIFLTFAFGMQLADVTKVIVCVYLVKMVMAWLDTPLIYLGVLIAKRRLGLHWRDETDDLLADADTYPDGAFGYLGFGKKG